MRRNLHAAQTLQNARALAQTMPDLLVLRGDICLNVNVLPTDHENR